MTAFCWAAVCAAAVLIGLCAYCAGRRAERLKKLREEINDYERLEKIRVRVDALPAGVLLDGLRAGADKK